MRFYYASILLIFSSLYSFSLTTEQLKSVPLEEIYHSLHKYTSHPEKFDRSLPFLMRIIENEKDEAFIGYHGHTQMFRVFQDLIKAAYEIRYDVVVPDDFHFLRIPGDPLFDLVEGTTSYYDLFDPKKVSDSLMEKTITELILNPIPELNLSYKDLSTDEKIALFKPIQNWVQWNLDQLEQPYKGIIWFENDKKFDQLYKNDWNYAYKKKLFDQFRLVKKGLLVDEKTNHKQAISVLIQHLGPLPKSIKQKIKQELSYQKMSQKGAYLFYNNDQEILNFLFPYNDVRPEQQSRVMSINFSLFSNFDFSSESSLHVYLNNQSIEGGECRSIELLKKYYQKIGIDHSIVSALFHKNLGVLNKHTKTGCILQFFDVDSSFKNADKFSYSSLPFGIPLKGIKPSSVASLNSSFIGKDGSYLQLRLLMTNEDTLNPNGPIRMKRYDLVPEAISKKLMEENKKTIRNNIK